MSATTNIPKILPVLAPSNVGSNGGRLEYGPKNKHANEYNRSLEPQVWEEFMATDPGSPEEEATARRLSEIFLGATAMQLIDGVKDEEIMARQSEWLTHQSIEIYGTQDVDDTHDVMCNDLKIFNSLIGSTIVDETELEKIIFIYGQLGILQETSDDSLSETAGNLDLGDIAFREYLDQEYGQILEHFDADTLYSATDLIEIAKKVLKMQAGKDDRWLEWKISTKEDGSMAVDTTTKEIKIGKNRAPSLGSEIGPSFLHELAVHATRSINGEATGDKDMQYGLPGYIDFEEGLGCYMEYVLTGSVPSKISNRQIAASLSLGQLGEGKKYDRNEIFEILSLRTKILLESQGEVSDELLDAKTKELRTLIIDRFFRGGRGVEPIKSVYTKDVIYAKGFTIVKKYVNDKINQGVEPRRLFDFLLTAKFDATNTDHLNRLKAAGITIVE
jgi:hypothetical protein